VRWVVEVFTPGKKMLARAIFVGAGCLAAWLIVLPALAVLGGAALFMYASLAEISNLALGRRPRPIDRSAIRSTARRICDGYSFSRR
jgi:siroheme synthase